MPVNMFCFLPSRFALALLFFVLCGLSPSAVAEEAEGCPGPAAGVSESVAAAFRSLRAVHLNALPGPVGLSLRDQKTALLIVENISSQRFASEVLGGSWASASEAQRGRWGRVLGELLRARVSKALRAPLRYEMTVSDVKVAASCEEASARLTLRDRVRDRETQVALKLVKHAPSWRVWDLSTDGASFVKIWQPRFRSILREQGIDGLEKEIAALGKRLGVPLEPGFARPGP